MRILVTGSRDFGHAPTIRAALRKAVGDQPGPHTLVHGDSRGADRLAANAARALGWTIEPHPADWTRPCNERCHHHGRKKRADGTTYCPSAGTLRNGAMVTLGADLLLAFYARGSRNSGTGDCVARAGAAHIPIRRFTA